ncbi:MAG: DEAD/DEAH box helicase family protein [Clostridia bacterium]|nr:DEAD/DEAH box helicase family protein [Clostridia bacterium]
MKEICEKAALKGSKVLVLAHRRLLLRQHAKIIQNVRLESVFTEVNHLGEHGKVDLIIIDEAHISGAESYQKVCKYYDCKRILFTATAKRLDNKPLSLADEILNGISADELIEQGAISHYDLYAPKLDIDLSKVSMSGSDFNNEQLSNVMCDRKIYGDIIKYYKELADGKQAIAYCTNIKHSESVRDLFIANGISAVHMDASTPDKIRDEIMQDYRNGKYQILCNVGLISEGITLPECECCLLLRPTQSESLYIQQSCRCLTPAKNKRAVIIDYVGNCYTHGMPTEKRIYTLDDSGPRIRNSSREPEVLCRECSNCLRVYRGTDPICPYCGANNGRTRQQIKMDKKAELERIEKIERINRAKEQGMAKSYEELVQIGIKRGMKNPKGWAWWVWTERNKGKIKIGKK